MADFIHRNKPTTIDSVLNKIKLNTPVLLFHRPGDNYDYMILFSMPDITNEKFRLNMVYDGESSNWQNVFTFSLHGPIISGYRLESRYKNKIYSPCKIRSNNGIYNLTSGATPFDEFIIARGQKEIEQLFNANLKDFNLHLYKNQVYALFNELSNVKP